MTNKAISPVRRSLLAATALTGVAAFAAPAFAQDDTIIVTGSRLNQANINSASPVFQVDASEIDSRGVTRIEELLNILPQAFSGQTSQTANGASGTSTLNLRGLGTLRTLVLVDGKRLPFGSPSSSASNLDLIPAQLIQRVDIVTGGASAVYGSDALGGVANFIMRRDYEGMMIDAQVGAFQDGNGNDFAAAVLGSAGIPVPGAKLDGRGVNVSVTFGANTADGRGNVTAFLSYQDQNEIRQDARDYSACAYGAAGPGPASIGGIGCVGSSTFRRTFNNGTFQPSVNGTPLTDEDGLPTQVQAISGGSTFLNADGTIVPYTGIVAQTFNFAPDNFIQRNNERFNFSAMSRYEITDNIEAYLDLGFTSNTTDAQIAFTGTFFRPFSVNCSNPLLGSGAGSFSNQLGCETPLETQRLDGMGNVILQDVLDAMGNQTFDPMGNLIQTPTFFPVLDGMGNPVLAGDIPGADIPLTFGYRNVTGDPRNSFIDLQTFRMVGGFRGTIGDNWNYDVFGQYAKTIQTRISTGDINFQSLQDALFVTGTAAAPVCRSGNGSCIPFDFFNNNVTRTQALSAQGNGFRNGNTKQIVLGGTLDGDLGQYGFQFPWAENGVQGLLGVEYRLDQLDSQPDTISQIPAGRGFTGVGGGTLPVKGQVQVWELFMETQIPLVEGRPFFEELAINGAYRFSNYSTDGNGVQNSFNTNTFSAGLTWSPTADVRLRGQFQRAVRAPNVIELFTGQNTGLFGASSGPNGLFDPCASAPAVGGTPAVAPSATAAQCAFTGASLAQYNAGITDNPAAQLNQVTGGNPLLTPESSNTYTFGVVLTPGFLPGFSASVDYFDITINDAISAVSPQTSLNQCIASGNPQFCNLITRDIFGTLFLTNTPPVGAAVAFSGINAANLNIANIATRGIDANLRYSHDFGGWGSLSTNYAATFLMEASSIPVPGVTTTVECKGLYGGQCGNPNAEYRHRVLSTWQTPWNFDVTATWRYTGGVDQDSGTPAVSNGGTSVPSGNVIDDAFDSASYLDISGQWYVRENVTLRAGVNNIFGRDPELTTFGGGFANGNTIAGVYDTGGRFFFFGVNIEM
ncbi:MAG: TonB-dependent receptor [Marinicaulis sp.]|nr:TonB-dependent receptor [Marinicaulis sp.]